MAKHLIWPNGIIFQQPRFPWNSRGFPETKSLPKLGAKKVVFSVAIIHHAWPVKVHEKNMVSDATEAPQ